MKSTLESVREKIIEAVRKDPKEHHEVLGRPIQLADVLMAVKKSYEKKSEEFWNEAGEEFYVLNTLKKWKLDKDLDNQPQETIDFLNKLLSNK